MAEKQARNKQYSYRENSNLVLAPERTGPRENEATGEAESLWGRMSGRMGDRAMSKSRDKEFTDRLEKMRKRAQKQTEEEGRKKKQRLEQEDVLHTDIDSGGRYKPKTRETRLAYQSLLGLIQTLLGDEPPDVLRDAADEVLYILKDEEMRAPDKKKQIEAILGGMDENQFADLMGIGRRITDFVEETGAQSGEGTLDDELGVAVVFDEEDDEPEEEGWEIKDDEESEDEGVETTEEMRALETLEGEDDMDTEDPLSVDAKEIKAFWIKGQVSKRIDSDPVNSQKIAEEIQKILEIEDERECENRLVQLLDFDKFDFIRILLRNRLKILWCEKLARVEDEAEREKIEDQMRADSQLAPILDELYRVGGKEKDLERTLRKEARLIKSKDKEQDEQADRPMNLIDFEKLAFSQGGHFMSNKKTQLPPGSFRKAKKGYEEIHVPALKAPPFKDDEKLVKISDMPKWAQAGFQGMVSLNRVQSRLYKAAFQSPENLLLCAPTGAGKTNVAMLCIMHELGLNMNSDQQLDLDNFKIVYIAPMKALVQETVGNFSKRLGDYGITVRELTGDMNLTKQQIKETQIIVTTPEKWDIITRKSGDRTFTQLVRLVIIDEIHLLHDDRGPVLESIIARSIRQIETSQEMIRLVGLSATLPNYEDVAMLLRVKQECLFAFDNSYRPCPLEQQYIGVTEKKAMKRLQLMNEITYEKVLEQAGKNQVLVFVHSRKETAKTARVLRDMALANDTLAKFLKDGSASKEILQTEAEESVKNEELKEILPYGFGIHHAGLNRSDRNLVEDLFADGHIQVLVSTATLAWGVNLPAHSVIIKGTQVYNPEKGRWCELSPMDIMQMLGRAGRPSFDTFGEGIIITSHAELQFYLSLLNQQLPIESQFISRLSDNLNAEIVLGTVQNIDEAVNWLGYTYLYICMLRNPTLYGITYDEAEQDKLLVQRRRDLIHSAAVRLDKANLIKYDRKSGNFQPTDLGVVASHYYVSYVSMQTYNEHLKPHMSDIDLFRLFSLSNEFKNITVRLEERPEMEKLLDRVPIPIKENMEEGSAKINALLQAYISRLKLDGFALMTDMVYVTQSAGRLMRALYEIVLKRGWAQLSAKTLTLCKMIDKRMWSSQSPLRQFKDIPEEVIKKMERKDFPFERLYDLNSQEIGELINFAPMGRTVHRHVHQFPRVELTAHVQPITRSMLRVELTITPDFQFDEKYHSNAESFWILVEDVDGEKILHSEFFILKRKFSEEEQIVTFSVPLFEPLHPQYFIRVVSDRWIASEAVLPISFRHLILPEKFPPPTELLDLRPLPVSELKNKKFEALYKDHFSNFLPVQTQTFSCLYNSDANTLVASPPGSGKTICGEFAILRMISNNPSGKCVYIGPLPAIAKARYRDWAVKFGEKLGISVVMLTGDQIQDLKLLERGQLIISTPEQWDVLSRRWKQRPNVSNISLFIVDEMHLVAGETGPTLEVITSRMRYISAEKKNSIRLVALSASIANGRDVADWIGATPQSCFNFHPNSRPVPLEIHMQGFDLAYFTARLMAMTRPTLYSVAHHAQGKPTIIFVPNRKQARLTAKDLINFYDSDDPAKRFLKCKEEDIAPHLEQIGNKPLREALSFGVGFYHEALSEKEKRIVEHLYNAGAIQIVIATHNECWGLTLEAHLVVIMGTQAYDGKEHGYADYPIHDILQMMGRASRPKEDNVSKCVLYCYGPKKDFYRKFLYDPLPVESHLDNFLADPMNAEVVMKTIENKQDAVDYLTWTLLYRRLTQNPNYYNIQGVSPRHLSDHLSELVETTLSDLEESRCITVENDYDVHPLNLGMIACYYNIKYTTIEMFNSSLKSSTKLKGLIEILSSASEFELLPIRQGEEKVLRKLGNHLPLKIDNPNYTNPASKVNVLLQAYFSRRGLTADLTADQDYVVENSIRLIQSMVDVISSSGWLTPALASMELAQMITQAVWDSDSILKQLPHFSDDLIQRCKAKDVESIFDLMDLEEKERNQLLKLSDREMQNVAVVANRYPNIELNYEIMDKKSIQSGKNVSVICQMEREIEEDEELGPVHAPFFPKEKAENWWLVIGERKSNQLVSIKRLVLQRQARVKLDFVAPAPGDHKYMLYFMCDSYTGCDQEYELDFHVEPADEEMKD